MKIANDIKAFSNGSIKKAIVTIITNPCFHCVCLYRLSNLFYKIKLSPLSKLIWYINRLLFHVDIDYRADLAGGFVLIHGLGTVIGAEVKSYGILKVYQGVTIGGTMGKSRVIDGKETGQPVFYENVTVFTDAKIFGPLKIGANNLIKAGSIVTEDVEEYVKEKKNN